MSDDIASLGFAIDSKPLARASDDLDDLTAAAGKAETASDSLASTANRTGTTIEAANDRAARSSDRMAAQMARAVQQIAQIQKSQEAARQVAIANQMQQEAAAAARLAQQAAAAARAAQSMGDVATRSARLMQAANDNWARSGTNANATAQAVTQQLQLTDRAARASATSLDSAAASTGRFRAMLQQIMPMFAPILAFFSARQITSYADTWSDLTARVRNAIGPMGNVANAMGRLSDMADRTYSSISQTAEIWLQSASVLKALGVATSDQLDIVEAVNNSLVISATRGDRARTVTEAWTKALAFGTLQGDNLNAVLMNSDRLTQALADSMGVSVLQLRSLGSQGKITRQDMIGITSQLSKLREEADAMPATVSDGFLRINNALLRLIGVYDQANNLSGSFAKGLVAVAENLELIAKLAILVGTALLTAFAARVIASIAAMVAQMVALEVALGAGSIAAALFGAAMKAVQTSITAVTIAMARNPLGFIAVAITTAIAALTLFRDDIKPLSGDMATLGDYMRVAWSGISGVVGGTRDYIVAALDVIDDAIRTTFGSGIADAVSAYFSWSRNIAVDTANFIVGAIVETVNAGIRKINTLIDLANKIPGIDIGHVAPIDGGLGTDYVGAAADAAMKLGASWRDAANQVAKSRAALEEQNVALEKQAAIQKQLTEEQRKKLKTAQQDIENIRAQTDATNAIAAAYGVSAEEVANVTAAQKAHQAYVKNAMVDEKALTAELLKEAAANQNLAAAQQLVADKMASANAERKAAIAMISDDSSRHAAELAADRQEYLNKLTEEYSLQLEKIPGLMKEFDQKQAYEEQARFWNDVRGLAQDYSNDIKDYLLDGLTGATNNGKSLWKNMWDTALAGGKRFLINFALTLAQQKFVMPILMDVIGSNSGFFGIVQQAMGGGSGASGGVASPSMMSNAGSLFGGQSGLLSTFQSGANWASNGLGFGSLFGGGAVTATSAAQAAGTVGAHAAPYVAGASGAGAGGSLTGVGSAAGSTGGLTAAASAIPVWGWIMAAAATVKSMVAGAPRDSAKGAVSTLLGPSMEEWQADPRRSLQNALNPIGTTLMDFGAPEWLGGAFNQFDPAGGLLKSLGAPSWLTPLTSLFGEKKPSNYVAGQVTNYANQSVGPALYDPSEASQTNIDAVQSLTSQLLELNKLLVSATGGVSTGVSTINVGSRDGLQAGFGTSFAQSQANTKSFANSAAGAQELLDYMAKSIATNLSGVTDPLYKKALQGANANDIVEGVQFVQTIKQALDASKPQTMSTALLELDTRYGQLINTSQRLGLATAEVIQLRDKEIAAIQKNVADQRDAFQTNLWERVWTLQGRDDLVFQSQLDTQRKQQLASAQSLLDQQIITQAQFSALSNILDQEVAKSLENFNAGLDTATTKLSRSDAAEMATNALSNVTSFVRGLSTSDLSPLNAQQKVALAQTEFDRVSGLARSGDAGAIGQFNEVSQTLLQLERQVYGSGTAYVDVYNKIIDAANQIGNLDPEQLIAKTIEISTQTQTQTLVEALAEVRDAVLQLRNQQSNKPALAA